MHLGAHHGSNARASVGEIGLQPSHYGSDCKRGRSSGPPRKSTSLPLPFTAEPSRGGREAFNRTAVPTVIAGVARSCEDMSLPPMPQAEPSENLQALQRYQQPQLAGGWNSELAKFPPLPYLSQQSPGQTPPKTQQAQQTLVKRKKCWKLEKPALHHCPHSLTTMVVSCDPGEPVIEETHIIPTRRWHLP